MSAQVLLGFDFGTRRIGVAVGQPLTGTATPLVTLKNHDGAPDWEAISRLLAEWQPVALVVGRPLTMDGSEQEMTRLARRFGNRLAGRYNLPVYSIDERLTSYEAKQRLANRENSHSNKADVDSIAAQVILQAWLDQHPTEDAQ
jgi:putative Holliday junction resolvase